MSATLVSYRTQARSTLTAKRGAVAEIASEAASAGTRLARLLDAAVDVLIALGTVRTTTLEVQKRPGVSRATCRPHVRDRGPAGQDERPGDPAGRSGERRGPGPARTRDPHHVGDLSSSLAGGEAGSAGGARTTGLPTALRCTEKMAEPESERVMGEFFPSLVDRPGLEQVVALILEFMRGLPVSSILETRCGGRCWSRTAWRPPARCPATPERAPGNLAGKSLPQAGFRVRAARPVRRAPGSAAGASPRAAPRRRGRSGPR